MYIVCIPADHSLWSRLFYGPLKMRRVPEKAVFGTEYLFRTVEAYFEHRVPQKTPSVQKKGVFMHRMPFPYRRSLFFAPNARHRGRLPSQRRRLPYLRRDNQVINLIEVRSFRRASENASHLVVRSTGKLVAVASERPV